MGMVAESWRDGGMHKACGEFGIDGHCPSCGRRMYPEDGDNWAGHVLVSPGMKAIALSACSADCCRRMATIARHSHGQSGAALRGEYLPEADADRLAQESGS